MGIMIVAGGTGLMAIAILVVALVSRRNNQPVPATWGSPAQQQPGRRRGARCTCGKGQLPFMWRHQYGRILGGTNYPVCRVAYQFNGEPLPEAQRQALLQVC